MSEINEKIKNKLNEYPLPVKNICIDIVSFARSNPIDTVKDHLDSKIRKAVKAKEMKNDSEKNGNQ